MKANRLDLLEEYIIARGSATLPELSENFNVSINTIRRDTNGGMTYVAQHFW